MPFPYASNGTEIYSTPESPETIMARQIPRRTAKLLEREAERRHYDARMAIGTNVVNNLVNKISQEAVENIENIEVNPNYTIKQGFLGIGKISFTSSLFSSNPVAVILKKKILKKKKVFKDFLREMFFDIINYKSNMFFFSCKITT